MIFKLKLRFLILLLIGIYLPSIFSLNEIYKVPRKTITVTTLKKKDNLNKRNNDNTELNETIISRLTYETWYYEGETDYEEVTEIPESTTSTEETITTSTEETITTSTEETITTSTEETITTSTDETITTSTDETTTTSTDETTTTSTDETTTTSADETTTTSTDETTTTSTDETTTTSTKEVTTTSTIEVTTTSTIEVTTTSTIEVTTEVEYCTEVAYIKDYCTEYEDFTDSIDIEDFTDFIDIEDFTDSIDIEDFTDFIDIEKFTDFIDTEEFTDFIDTEDFLVNENCTKIEECIEIKNFLKIIITINIIKTKPYINDIFDAISHYVGKTGETVHASNQLIDEIKNDNYKKILENLKCTIKNKITDDIIEKGEEIKAEPGSRRANSCMTLGSHSLNIDYSFIPVKGKNVVKVHFWGSDLWDFENNKCYNVWENLIKERIPYLFLYYIFGGGKPFKINYDFYDYVVVDY